MALRRKKTPEELAAKDREVFERSPVGRARAGFDRGDQVFQCSIGATKQQGVIAAIIDSATGQRESDPVAVLNSVCREGWELVNGSFVFVEQGQQARAMTMESGQYVAVEGEVVGYYLFKRCEANRRTQPAG
ncbi:hypothetical protein AB0J40_09440 [Amycolatopsis sp. NPDC049691]|uniref:hypothetical protein n=1 Tax=Amycolatopsis sp. NPDC049691 TaxID=3155155 RepID=UPI00341D07EF